MLQRFEDAKANNAIEGLVMSADDEAFFVSLLEQGLDAGTRKQMINSYLAGELHAPVLAAAE